MAMSAGSKARPWLRRALGIALFCFLNCALTPARAQYRTRFPLPTASIPESLGVNIHFTDPKPGEMQQLAAAGFRWVRMDFDWAGIERQKGSYDFSAYDRLLDTLKPYHIRPIFILDYGNDLYEQGPPRTEEARAAFCRFVRAAITHFRHRGILWEMWNEPNGAGFWGGRPNVDEYSALGLAVGKTIRAAAPDEWFIGPAVSGMDFKFMERCFQVGLLNYWDAVSFHPYRDKAPETAAPDFERVRELIARYAPGKRIPILSGEWGYSELYSGLDLQKQSRYISREFLSDIANGLILSIWYDWHDDGTDPKEVEHHFGTVFNDYRPKPTYTAVQTLATTLNGFTYNKRLALKSPDDYCLLFTRGAQTRLAVWTADQKPHEVTLPASAGEFDVVGNTGERSTLTASRSGLTLTLSDAPQYLIPKASNTLLTLAAVWATMPPYLALGDKDDYEASFSPARKVLQQLELMQVPAATVLVENLSRPGKSLSRLYADRFGDDTGRLLLAGRLAGNQVVFFSYSQSARLLDRSETPHRVRARLILDRGGSLAQDTVVVQRDPLRVMPLPAVGSRLSVQVENPSGRPFRGQIELRYGDAGLKYGGSKQTLPLVFQPEQRVQEPTFDLPNPPDRNYSVQVAILEDSDMKFGHRGRSPVLVTPIFTFAMLETFGEYVTGVPPPDSDYRIVPDGDPKVQSDILAQVITPPPGISGATRALQIDYDFARGWKFLQVMPQGEKHPPLPGKPLALGMWVYSYGSGDALRARFDDATGQTFQPDAGDLDWKGWRYITFSLRGDNGGWWGGAGDGIVHYPIRLQTVLLVDSPGGRGGQGRVTFTGVTLVNEQP